MSRTTKATRMSIRIRKNRGLYRLQPEGEMSIYTAAQMKAPLIEAVRRCKTLEIDLNKVSEIDTAGFQLLLLAKREADRLGKPLRLTGHSHATSELMEIFHLADHFAEPATPNQNNHG